MTTPCVSGESEAKARMKPESNQEPTNDEIREEVRKYLRLLPQIAEPNLARVREIKEQIKEGTYLTRELIEETASRLALRFLRRE